MARTPLDEATLRALEGHVDLPLSDARRAALVPALEGMLAQFDRLFDVDAGETPPVHSFDARWRDAP